jgi:ATP-dependent DNA helicase PIF1
MSASECVWRILGFKMSHMSHSVQPLPVHLEGQHMVSFNADGKIDGVVENNENSKLTMFFRFCQQNPELCKDITYPQAFKVATWQGKKWQVRKNVGISNKTLGRMYTVSPKAGDRYFLRMLLNSIKCIGYFNITMIQGPISYTFLRTTDVADAIVGQVVHTSNKGACIALGLLEDDREWYNAMDEALLSHMPSQLRSLFALILVFGMPAAPIEIWDHCYNGMGEDFVHNNPTMEATVLEAKVLHEIDQTLMQHGTSIADYPDLPQINFNLLGNDDVIDNLLFEETHYNQDNMNTSMANVELLTIEQRPIYNEVNSAIDEKRPLRLFVEGCGGSGKSFLFKLLLSANRLKARVCLAVASSGIASLLMQGGRTAHSRFKIPLDLHHDSSCTVSKNSKLAKLLISAELIIWDEVPMTHKHAYEAVDRLLKDLMNSVLPFGGKVIVFGGDFRQIPPVIPRGSKAQIITASINKSQLWQHFEIRKLTINKRVELNIGDPDAKSFSEYLLRVGDGTEVEEQHGSEFLIKLPDCFTLRNKTIQGLIDHVYDNFDTNNQVF